MSRVSAAISIEMGDCTSVDRVIDELFDDGATVNEDLTTTYAMDCGWWKSLGDCYDEQFDMLVITDDGNVRREAAT